MKHSLKTIFKPIFLACSCGSTTVRPSCHSYYTPGPQVSPTVLRSPCPTIDKSVAVDKESINPFQDYKNSMNQMIDERDIETQDDLKDLLRCFGHKPSSSSQSHRTCFCGRVFTSSATTRPAWKVTWKIAPSLCYSSLIIMNHY